ncbi:hypothetical protein TNCV_2462751 [Trichonephila clavipes]|nr:hypothetical protein TNCV_2462751 [Trichonephila clavipes]
MRGWLMILTGVLVWSIGCAEAAFMNYDRSGIVSDMLCQLNGSKAHDSLDLLQQQLNDLKSFFFVKKPKQSDSVSWFNVQLMPKPS